MTPVAFARTNAIGGLTDNISPAGGSSHGFIQNCS